MIEHVYVLTGRLLPERALITVGEIQFSVEAPGDVPRGLISVEIINSQIFVIYKADAEVKNIFTLRNIAEDAIRMIVDGAGYVHGYAYDVEIIQMTRPGTAEKYVYGIDVPALAGECDRVGVGLEQVFESLTGPNSYFVRHALADLREAIKSTKDTGFFCYRAIESLKNGFITEQNFKGNRKAEWALFRNRYGITEEDIKEIKSFADPIRHGNYIEAKPITDAERAHIFKSTWAMVNKFILGQKKAPPFKTDRAAPALDSATCL